MFFYQNNWGMQTQEHAVLQNILTALDGGKKTLKKKRVIHLDFP